MTRYSDPTARAAMDRIASTDERLHGRLMAARAAIDDCMEDLRRR